MLIGVGTSPCGFVRNIFDRFLLSKVPLLDRGRDAAALMHFRVAVAMIRSVPTDSLKVPKRTSRHSGRFMQLFKDFFEVEKTKYFLYTSNKRVLHGFYTRLFSSVQDAMTKTSRVVKDLEVDRREPNGEFGFQTSL